MDLLNFEFFNSKNKSSVSFDSNSQKFKDFVKIAIDELEKIQQIKGFISNSTLSPHNRENFEDDMKTLIACEVAINVLKNAIDREA